MFNYCPTHSGETLSSGFFHRRIHYTDDPAKDAEWVKKESVKYFGTHTARWRREMEIDWDIYGGERVWPMLDRKYHSAIINLNEDWALFRIIDHGFRHPTCCLWVAVNRNGDRHVYREYYATDKTIAINSKQILRLTGDEQIIDNFIDPSTRSRINYLTSDPTADRQGLRRRIDIYEDNGLCCSLADNCAAGYDKVTDGFLSQLARYALRTSEIPPYLQEMDINQEQLLMLSSKSSISFDLRFVPRAFRETEGLRWKEITGDETQRSEPEKTVDVADEGPDCVRYAVQSDLFWKRPIPKFDRGSQKSVALKRYLKRKLKGHRSWAC